MHKMLLDLPTQLETNRLVMRPYQSGDGPEYFAFIERNKDHLQNAANEQLLSIKTEIDAEIYVRELAANWVSRDRFVFLVLKKDCAEFVAEIWIEPSDWEDGPIFEIGWFVDKDHQGQGFVTEAARRSLKFLFHDLNAHKVAVTTDDTNVRSYQVAERCGFRQEGCLRKRKKSKQGQWTNTLYYGMLREEYDSENGR